MMPAGSGVIEYRGKRDVAFRVKYRDGEGRQIMETVGYASDGFTRKKAEAELRERLVRVERKGWRRPAPLTFAQYAERWFSEGPERRGWTPRTCTQYASVQRRLVKAFGTTPLAAVRPRDVAEYVRACTANGMAPASVVRDMAVLSGLFKTARREELVDTNPAEAAERPKVRRRRWRILDPAEVQRVSRAFEDEQDRLVFLTAVLLGLRRSELQALRWRDLDLLEAILRVERSKSEAGERSIAIPPSLLKALSDHYQRTTYRGDDELVFCHPERGTIYRPYVFAAALKAALKAAGVEAELRPFHDLRHASLTNGAAAGESPIALMTRAGHSDMATTRVYLHLAGTVFRDEAERLEDRLLGGVLLRTSSHDDADPSTESSTRLSASDVILADSAPLEHAESDASDVI
jgi:integrase